VAFFLVVEHRSGPEWKPGLPLRQQSGFDAHAALMDELVDRGLIVLGGPLADEHRVVLVFEAESEDAVRAALQPDPWIPSHLVIASIEPWTVLLEGRVSWG
jgi:uncharacterized protein YciI